MTATACDDGRHDQAVAVTRLLRTLAPRTARTAHRFGRALPAASHPP